MTEHSQTLACSLQTHQRAFWRFRLPPPSLSTSQMPCPSAFPGLAAAGPSPPGGGGGGGNSRPPTSKGTERAQVTERNAGPAASSSRAALLLPAPSKCGPTHLPTPPGGGPGAAPRQARGLLPNPPRRGPRIGREDVGTEDSPVGLRSSVPLLSCIPCLCLQLHGCSGYLPAWPWIPRVDTMCSSFSGPCSCWSCSWHALPTLCQLGRHVNTAHIAQMLPLP